MGIPGADRDPLHTASGPLGSTTFEVSPAAQTEESTIDKQTGAIPAPATTGLTRTPTPKKFKDLLAPREEEGELLKMHGAVSPQASLTCFTGFSLIGHLDLNLELNFDMKLNLNKPAFPSATVLVPRTMPSCGVLSTSAHTTQHNALDSSLPFSFPQKGPAPRFRFCAHAG